MASMQAERRLADRYVLVRRLASGGMGEVWQARDGVLGRDVAVKVIVVGSDSDPQAVERFRREAVMTAALEHPNVVTIFDSGTHQGSAFIVMELLAGPTLAQFVADRGPLPEPEAVRLAAQIAAGLAAAHGAGVVHRDIKPSNLMFSSSGMLKVLDFGIARLSQTAAPALTQANTVIGSAPYLSPEQAVGAPADERSDLYALGCVIVTMVTGGPPFSGEHPIAVLHQHIHDDAPLLRSLRPEISPDLENLVGQLLSKRAGDRPASADEVEQRLTRIMADSDRTAPAATAILVPGVVPAQTRPTAQAAARTDPTALYPTALYPTAPLPADPAHPDVRRGRPAGPPRPRQRSWWLIAAILLAGAVLAAAVLTPLLSRSGAGALEPSTARTPSIQPTPSASAPSSSLRPSPPASSNAQPTSPLANVREVVDALVADGQMDPRRAEEFGQRLDNLAKRLDEGKKGAGKQVDDLSKYLAKLVKSGELTPDGSRRIEAALARV